MEKILLLLLVTHYVLFSNICEGADDFDFFYLVYQWPGSLCGTEIPKCCKPHTGKPPVNVVIHGLWPTKNDNSKIEFCDANSFSKAEVGLGIISEMEREWPDFRCEKGDGTHLWRQQWIKHGSCAGLKMSEYFSHAIRLKKSVNLYDILMKGGIEPNGTSYKLSYINDVIFTKTNLKTYITCNKKGGDGMNKQLYEVRFCVDKSTKEFKNCTRSSSFDCASDVIFPKYPTLHPNIK